MATKSFIVKNGLQVGGNVTATGNLVIEGTITGDGSGLSGVTSYTISNFDSDFGSKSTSNLAEGSNQYFTTARARNAMVAGSGIVYDSASGVISTAGGAAADLFDSADFTIAFAAETTTNLSEGDNLYYTDARVATKIDSYVTGGTGVTVTSGSVAIGQAVATTSDVTFAKITGDSASLDGITFNSQATPFAGNVTPGSLWFDSDPQKGLSFKPATPEGNTSLTLNLGQESVVFSHNATGETIPNGTVVYVSGTAHGIHPSITKAQANVGAPGNLGVTTMDIVDGAHGYVTRFGLVRGLNTNGLSAGADVYLSADSAGVWTTTPVTVDTGYPHHIGKVVATDATEGTILVDPFRENFEYLRIQDRLKVTGPIEGTTLALDSSMSMTPIAYANRPAYVEGKMWYDGDGQTMAFHTDTEDYIQFIGERNWVRGRNSTGSAILKGTPVYTDGAHIAGHVIHGHHPLLHVADASLSSAYEVMGIAAHDIADGSHGYVLTHGWIDGLNTAGLVSGDRFHLASGGGYQLGAATYPNYPVDLGIAMTIDSAGGNGSIYVDINSHTLEQLRVTGDGRVDGNWTVGGNLNVIGTTTSTLNQSVIVPSQFIVLLDGDTLGTAYQSVGGLNDATFKGKYTGDSDLFYFARISAIDSAGAGGDTLEWGISDSEQMLYGSLAGGYGYGLGFESDGGQATWQLGVDGLRAPLRNGISLQIINVSGHTDSDDWCAHPVEINADVGMIANYNPSGAGGLLHTGVFRDVTDARWKFFDGYDSALDSSSVEINTANAGFSLADIQFGTAYGALSGNASTATTAGALTTGRTIAISGDITASGVTFDGTSGITLTSAITTGSIINADINASAAIVDTKLATIATAGKVSNSATTATSANTGSAIVARDASGNFSAGTVTATSFVGNGASLTGLPAGYTITNFDSDFSDKTTNNLIEGNANLYHTTARARGSISVTDVSGDGSLAYNSTSGVITYTGPSATEVRAHLSASTGLTFTSGAFSITNTAVTAATYGDATNIPQIAVNAQGQITGVTNISVAPGYTITNFDSDFGSQTTNDLTEGTNLYFTTARAVGAISVTDAGGDGSLSYNGGTGVITYTGPSASEVRAHITASTGISITSGAVSNTGVLTVNGVAGAVTAANLMTAIQTVDGAASALDADLLDGQHGAYYRINVYNNAGTLLN